MAWTHVIAKRGKPSREWDPRNPPQLADFAYLGALAATAEDALPEPDLTLVVTTDHRSLPVYGRDVVVIQRAGPDARPPDYAHRVLAVFKTHAPHPVLSARPGREPPALTATSVLSWLQVLGMGAPARLRRRVRAAAALARGRARPVVESIPMGVMWMPEIACVPVAERPVDVLFDGSVETDTRGG